MQFRTLQAGDAANLLEFELANRAWFEKTVRAREDDFYSVGGIEAHIRDCLEAHALGTMHPGVMIAAGGAIAGRAGLRNIDPVQGTCEIGYRIAEQHCGKGWASASVPYLQQLAYGMWGLTSLQAYVSIENPASARVLEKNGFVRMELARERSLVRNRLLDSYRYRHIPA